MRLIYLAHPFGGDPKNLLRAKAWLGWAAGIARPSNGFVVAPWIPLCETHSDSDTATREFMLAGDCEVVTRCDALWLVGRELSPGMAREALAATRTGVRVCRLIGMDYEQAHNALSDLRAI